jgi:hypothetical protein
LFCVIAENISSRFLIKNFRKTEKSASDYPFGEWTKREKWRKINHNRRCIPHPWYEKFMEKGVKKDGLSMQYRCALFTPLLVLPVQK